MLAKVSLVSLGIAQLVACESVLISQIHSNCALLPQTEVHPPLFDWCLGELLLRAIGIRSAPKMIRAPDFSTASGLRC
jgi:hypothetical protein